MAEPRPAHTRRTAASMLLLAFLAAGLLAAGFASAALAAPPDETCTPGQTFAAGDFDVCAPPVIGGPGSSGIAIGGLLPILVAVLIAAGLALVVAYFVLRRRAGGPLDPVDAGEWWTCANCGRQNVVGTSRCFACGSWQGGSRPERPTDKPAADR